MGMIDGRAGSFSVIFENEDVAKALVILEVQHAIPITPEDVFDGAFRQSGQRCTMVRRHDDHFVRADSIHLVKETFSFTVQFAFDAERGKFVRHNADAPAWRVWASAVPAVDENFRGSTGFVADTEGAILFFSWDDALSQEVVGTLSSFR